ncbi:MAG: TonB-dependent receptor [Odoribacteraceae bacterium]|jgi:hypothetical protein|nr:TonB-dependent receptor [Odoribacteraceae bacterium]
MRCICCLLLALLAGMTAGAAGQEVSFTVRGRISGEDSGRGLAGANVSVNVEGSRRGSAADARGDYALRLPAGRHALTFSFIGYAAREVTVELSADRVVNVSLSPRANEIAGVVVSAAGRRTERPEMNVERLSALAIKQLPALMGEVDVIKAIQMLPGVQSTAEGSSGFSVRGGSHDQNLILLDDATVYGASHLMGFFSVFNNDAIKEVTLYKGDVPATFGGRLSSLLEIRSKEGNGERLAGAGGIGVIASRLTLEGPIGRGVSFIASGRRTYADVFLALSPDKDLRGTALHFYDLNGRVDARAGERDRLFVSAYAGEDKFANKSAGMTFGNKAVTAGWSHAFSADLLARATVSGSSYNYYIGSDIGEQLAQDWASAMSDVGGKVEVAWQARPGLELKFGYAAAMHRFSPGDGGGIGDDALFERVRHPVQRAREQAFFGDAMVGAGEGLTLRLGLRYSVFSNVAGGGEVKYLQDHLYHHSEFPRRGAVYHSYRHLEPRVGVTWLVGSEGSVKASYARSVQYVQVASNSAAGSPLDVWFQASPNVRPQRGDQLAAGYFRNLGDAWELSVEVYGRLARGVIDFKDHASLLGNENLEEEVRAGKGRGAGMEWMARANDAPVTGWVSYTYSRSWRQAKGINGDAWYRSPYDKPHVVTVVANRDVSARWRVSANWIYATGHPVTYPTGRVLVENRYVPTYSGRNEFRFPDYHRLDLSATRLLLRAGARVTSELNFSLYNAYGRKNPWSIFFRQEKEQPDVSYAEQIYLFGVVPSVTWNFTF